MVINSSHVALDSSRTYQSYTQTQTASVVTRGGEAVSLDLSDKSMSLVEQMNQYKEELNHKNNGNGQKLFQNTIADKKVKEPSEVFEPEEDGEIILLRKMLEALNETRNGKNPKRIKKLDEIKLPKKAFSFGSVSVKAASTNMQAVVTDLRGTVSAAAGTGGTLFTKTTAISSIFSENEHTTFEGIGIARTADGREISFNVTLDMSRAFIEKYDALESSSYIVTDPLVINLADGRTSLTDKKYSFDLDSDGDLEEMSFTGTGSGFLALDKNGDDIINDGNELFGTKSGDGFADLAAYDEDGNGWIDEADSVFKNLKVWTKDDDGNDKLLDLKEADVGAIYLGSADTEFSLKETATNDTNGIIRKTGVYLKESGSAGTVAHVDLVI